MNYLFSPSTISFYPKEIKHLYEKNNTLPTDVVEISDEIFKEFALQTPPENKTRGVNTQGQLVWLDIVMTEEDKINTEKSWIFSELNRTRDELEKVQDADPDAFGSVSVWREYRKALRAWPESPEFPDKTKRPKAPDFKE